MENRHLAPARFFMAEDNPGDVLLMRTAIEEIGLDAVVEVAGDGAAAVERLLDPGHQSPDIIILNFNLPKMQGHEVLTVIKRTERLRGIPVVMLTSSDALRDRLVSRTADAYFVKSGSYDDLLAIVRHLRDLISAHPSERPTTQRKLSGDPFWKQGDMGPQGTHEHPIAGLGLRPASEREHVGEQLDPSE
jgi:CheY-like chemotaxis protein